MAVQINHEKAKQLYNEIKNIILSKKDEQSFEYERKQHDMHEYETKYPGISANYYNEKGIVKFVNNNDELIKLEIYRCHGHKSRGFGGLNGTPRLRAVIYRVIGEYEKELWKLEVESKTLYYNAETSSLEIPYDILSVHPPTNLEVNRTEATKIEKVQTLEPQGTKIIFNEICELCNRYRVAQCISENVLSEIKAEIEAATEKIINSYSEKISKVEKDVISIQEELITFNTLLIKYSSFNIDLAAMAIKQLISTVENEEYFVLNCNDGTQSMGMAIIRKESYENSGEIEIESHVKSGEAIILLQKYNSYNNGKNITFYRLKNECVVCDIDFGRFSYIKRFIDSLVQYRFQNAITEITEKDILSFMKDFIFKNIVIENHWCKLKKKY